MPRPMFLTAVLYCMSFITTSNWVKIPTLSLGCDLTQVSWSSWGLNVTRYVHDLCLVPRSACHVAAPLLPHLGPQEDIPTAFWSSEEVSESDAAEKAIFCCSCADRFLIFNQGDLQLGERAGLVIKSLLLGLPHLPVGLFIHFQSHNLILQQLMGRC